MTNHNLFVITGGPGAGKTTVLDELQRRGFPVLPEVARAIIQEQVSLDGDALPWKNTERFAKLMLDRSVESYLVNAATTQTTLVDRGIPDTLCYAGIIGMKDTAEIESACRDYRYNKRVFIAPPWREIYTVDTERKQTWEEAVDGYRRILIVYEQCGYELIELPKINVAQRADFMIRHLIAVI